MQTLFFWFQSHGWHSGWMALAGGVVGLLVLAAIFLYVNRDDFI
ncbi:hypothetical protein [Neptuniibacter sp. CAU 1671]|nr:hypothetical protein [Neptuniibacter sp. CAU 1671]MDF2182428.1 hypothetical protein [Neptuniibacter sp. CAU 1671]